MIMKYTYVEEIIYKRQLNMFNEENTNVIQHGTEYRVSRNEMFLKLSRLVVTESKGHEQLYSNCTVFFWGVTL
jgi:hypothetical protein